jgi:8-oxo-dGTP diphosphatase
MPTAVLAAAGGVVWRNDGSTLRIAVVHRPYYDDWTLPKGKLDKGESELACAVREVREEIGADVVVQRRLRAVHYPVGGVEKRVAYWVMRHVGGDFLANDEVDELRWLTVAQAREQLTFDTDRSVLADFSELPVPESMVLLVRHAKAGKRSHWDGEDDLRPLEHAGEKQAVALARQLGYFAPRRVLAGVPLRCRQTVLPLASSLELAVEIEPAFSDVNYVQAPIVTEAALLGLAKPGQVTAVCSQGTTIPGLIAHLAPTVPSVETRKGEWWALSFVDGELVAADHYTR